ncbi:unnamed protein product [Caenorhabditis angaria]|uniref:TIL domain-containing protein n=1 Tax=Caenorhabditis angaria TaxID=860376 RepID=A0A9P1N039_9PELO|nr:unnamed protein product [Caenorhabditis angaria]
MRLFILFFFIFFIKFSHQQIGSQKCATDYNCPRMETCLITGNQLIGRCTLVCANDDKDCPDEYYCNIEHNPSYCKLKSSKN